MPSEQETIDSIVKASGIFAEMMRKYVGHDVSIVWAVINDSNNHVASGSAISSGISYPRFCILSDQINRKLAEVKFNNNVGNDPLPPLKF